MSSAVFRIPITYERLYDAAPGQGLRNRKEQAKLKAAKTPAAIHHETRQQRRLAARQAAKGKS